MAEVLVSVLTSYFSGGGGANDNGGVSSISEYDGRGGERWLSVGGIANVSSERNRKAQKRKDRILSE